MILIICTICKMKNPCGEPLIRLQFQDNFLPGNTLKFAKESEFCCGNEDSAPLELKGVLGGSNKLYSWGS